jgi:hypothetical protein
MKTLYESILDDEDVLVQDTKQYIKDEIARQKIEKLAHEIRIKFNFDPYFGTIEMIEGEDPEDARKILAEIDTYEQPLDGFIDILPEIIKSRVWIKYKKELSKSNLKYKDALLDSAVRIEQCVENIEG